MRRIVAVASAAVVLAAAWAGPASARSEVRVSLHPAGVILGALGVIGVLSALDHLEAHAGPPGYRWEGPPQGEGWRYDRGYRPSYGGGRPEVWNPGHWEWQRVWVPGHWERVWVREGYDEYGWWRPAHWAERPVEGYYAQRQVWVEGK
jgi:hypothetical protein